MAQTKEADGLNQFERRHRRGHTSTDTMSTQEDSWERLDSYFDHYLLEMKPYVLKLINRTERQCCAEWIKKLCDPAACGSGLSGRKNRNMYARLLLHMLTRGVLEGPFTANPEPGLLKILPTYMSIYFDEPVGQMSGEPPDWVAMVLGSKNDDVWASSLLKDRTHSPNPASSARRGLFDKSSSRLLTPGLRKTSSSEYIRMVDGGMNSEASPDDSDLEARLNSWNLGIENPRYLRDKAAPLSPIFKSSLARNSTLMDEEGPPPVIQTKEMEMKIKLLEAKHQEEKLKWQQRHDIDVQKILDRKNQETEELKATYRTKQRESDEAIRKLEKKVQSLLRESQVIHESKDKQIAELKKMLDQSADSLKNEWEKKLHAALSGMEQEKFEMQKKHTENIQELLEDTNRRLANMEAEFSGHTQATEQTVRELEARVKQQSCELQKGVALRQKVTQDKAQLEIHVAMLSAELQDASQRNMSLQKEMEEQSQQHAEALWKLQTKHEADMNHYQHEHVTSAAKASGAMEDLEHRVAELRQQLKDSESQCQRQLREREAMFQQERNALQISWEKKVLALHNEAERERTDAAKTVTKLEESLRETAGQLERAKESQRQQAHQAEVDVEQFKKQAYADMKLQMDKVEEDLLRSKTLREKQANDFSQQLASLKQKYEEQMAAQRVQQEQERTRVLQLHSAERDSLVQERQREVGSLERQARAVLQQHQQHTQEWRKRDAQTISELEEEVAGLRQDLQAAHAQRKQQAAEAAQRREEERQRAAQEHEVSLGRLRAEMACLRSSLEKSHQQEKEAAQEKANSRLKQIEKEFGQKLAKAAQIIAELQTKVCDSKEKQVHLQQSLEKQLEEANTHWDQERKTMTHHADQTSKALQEKVENLQRRLHSSEKKLLCKELKFQEQLTVVRQECEAKLKGLMPAEVTQELEETIVSLKAQVGCLEKRANLLQKDLIGCRRSNV